MARIDLDFDLLRCFVAVAETGGFTAAGERIGLTQSGISVRIRKLEQRLGRRLLARTSRSVTPTEEGEQFLNYARRMIDLNDEAVARMTGVQAEGRLNLGIADYVVPRLLPDLLGRFARLQPGVKMEMRTGLSVDLMPAFEQGEIDLVIAGRGLLFKAGELLYRDPLIWVAAPGFPLRLDRPLPLAALPAFCTHRRLSLESLDRAGIGWEMVYSGSSSAGVLAAVTGGLGVAAIPISSMNSQLRQLGEADGLPPLPSSEIALFRREERLSPCAEAFVAFLGEELTAA
jgi:DNA-binding transcriptional LysR family regulator